MFLKRITLEKNSATRFQYRGTYWFRFTDFLANGAGKTSFIRIINQITQADTGEIFINGEKLNPNHIKDIGYMPEERGLYKNMTVGDQLSISEN